MTKRLTWISQVSKGNSYSCVSKEYLKWFHEIENWIVNIIDISKDTPVDDFNRQLTEQYPDLVIVLHNDSNQMSIIPHLLNWRGNRTCKFAAFTPVDFTANVSLCDLSGYDFLITMNEFSRDVLLGLYPNKQVHLLYHIVDIENVFDKNTSKQNICRQYGIDPSLFLVGICNANNIRKRHDLAIHVFAEFYKKYNNSHLIIKTTGKDSGPRVFNDWEQLTKGLPVTIIETRIENLLEFYNACDIMINCTDGEGFGLTPFEAARVDTFTILPYNSSFTSFLPRDLCVDCLFLPGEYVRSTDDIIKRLSGNEIFLVYQGPGTIDYIIEDVKTIDRYLHAKNIYIKSDINTLRDFFSYAVGSKLDIDLVRLEYYVDHCYVGIVKVDEMTDRLCQYYLDSIKLANDLERLKMIDFSWPVVKSQLVQILNNFQNVNDSNG